MMRQNTDRNAKLADILITPDVSGFGFTDFADAEELSQLGYDATAELAEQIGSFSLSEEEWAEFLRSREERRRSFEATPEFLEVSGATEIDKPVVETALAGHLGVALDPDSLDFTNPFYKQREQEVRRTKEEN